METALQIFHGHKSPKPKKGQTISKTANKYGNKWIIIDDIKFQSTGEGYYYLELKERLLRGDVKEIKRQIPFEFVVNGIRIGKYVADFGVLHFNGSLEILDYKSRFTATIPLYDLKKQLMLACFGVAIKEVGVK